MKTEIHVNGVKHSIEYDLSCTQFSVDGRQIIADVVLLSPGTYSILLSGRAVEVAVEKVGDGLLARAAGREFQVQILDPRSWRRAHVGNLELQGRQQMAAPMPGKIVRVLAKAGEKVEAGQGLLVIEAMKMQNEMRSPKSGIVERIAQEGKTVTAGEILAVVT